MSLDDVAVLAPDSTGADVASGAAGDGGAGVADTSIATAGDSGATTSIESTQDVTTGTEATAEGSTTQQPVTDTSWQGQPVSLPDAIRKLQADQALSANPLVSDALKQVQSAFDRLNAYTTHLPTVADAKKFTEAFPGGIQDALTAQQRAQRMDESDNIFYSRDPQQHRSLAETWAKDDPDAFAVLSKSGLEVLAESNPQAYQSIGQEILEQTLVGMLTTAYRTGNTEAAQRINQVHQDIFGRKPGEQPRTDPRDQKFQQREQQISQREQNFLNSVALNFANGNNAQAGQRISSSIDSTLKTALNGVKITDAARQRIAKECYDEINQKLLIDKALDNQLNSIRTSGLRSGRFTPQQQEQWVNAVYSKGRNLVQQVVADKVNEWTTNFLGLKKADTNKREQAGQRTDITGSGSPNLSMKPLTGDKIAAMSDEDFRNYKGPIDPNWRKQYQDARFARK